MDELAEKMGVDPLELRYKNVYRPGDTTPNGCPPDVYSLPEMIDKLRPLYKEALAKAKKASTPDRKKGVGVSIGIYGCGLDGPDSSEIWVELTPEGVTVGTSWEDHGQGADMGAIATAHKTPGAARNRREQDQSRHVRHRIDPEQRACGRQPVSGGCRAVHSGRVRNAPQCHEETRRGLQDLR